MQKIYWFNPTHDLALAHGNENYIPPAAALRMEADLALLPLWYMGEGDIIRVRSKEEREYLEMWKTRFNSPAIKEVEEGFALNEVSAVCPWGWNSFLRKQLLVLGIPETHLPTEAYITLVRSYSHREKAVQMLPTLRLNNYFCGESFYLRTPEEWKKFVETRGACLLKAPLSGSGKGLVYCKEGGLTEAIAGWCARVANTQGGVVGEPVYKKAEDFAMEFRVADNKVSFVGYSLFCTDKKGKYTGSHLLPDKAILQYLSNYVPVEELLKLQSRVESSLQSLVASFYNGYLGVDMMICHFPGETPEYRIHPCVEINLRMNMGVVARLLTNRYIASCSKGMLHLLCLPREGMAVEMHKSMEESYPLHIVDKRIVSGYCALAPVTPQSRYMAFVQVEY